MTASSVQRFLELLAQAGDGYGPSSVAASAAVIRRLLLEGVLRGPLLEARPLDVTGGHGTMLCGALTGFVELARARAWVEAPPDHLVDHILAREQAGEALLLRPQRVASLNATEGLGLVFMAYKMVASPEEQSVVIPAMFENFRLFHAGYYCPLSLHPPGNTSRGDVSLRGLGFRPIGSGSVWLLDIAEVEKAPFNPFIVLARSLPPRFGFSTGEKDLLMQALLGNNDVEIAAELALSVETIKKRWRVIFDRVSERPELRILPQPVESEEAKRGPEKRGALLKYLHGHLEELRPYALQGP